MIPTTTANDFLAALGKAAAGLLFPSESEFPLTPYRWVGPRDAAPSPAALLASEGRPADTPVETLTVGELFAPLATEAPGAGSEERAEAARYRALVSHLEEGLLHLRAYRVGRVDIDVVVLGQHASGEWLGLKTHVVET